MIREKQRLETIFFRLCLLIKAFIGHPRLPLKSFAGGPQHFERMCSVWYMDQMRHEHYDFAFTHYSNYIEFEDG